jgi:hypothetical protein
MAHFNLYSQVGVVLTAPKIRLVRVIDSMAWSVVTRKLARPVDIADTVIDLGEIDPTVNGWPVTLPKGLPAGEYDIPIYEGIPSLGSPVTLATRIQWNGKKMLGIPYGV